MTICFLLISNSVSACDSTPHSKKHSTCSPYSTADGSTHSLSSLLAWQTLYAIQYNCRKPLPVSKSFYRFPVKIVWQGNVLW